MACWLALIPFDCRALRSAGFMEMVELFLHCTYHGYSRRSAPFLYLVVVKSPRLIDVEIRCTKPRRSAKAVYRRHRLCHITSQPVLRASCKSIRMCKNVSFSSFVPTILSDIFISSQRHGRLSAVGTRQLTNRLYMSVHPSRPQTTPPNNGQLRKCLFVSI